MGDIRHRLGMRQSKASPGWGRVCPIPDNRSLPMQRLRALVISLLSLVLVAGCAHGPEAFAPREGFASALAAGDFADDAEARQVAKGRGGGRAGETCLVGGARSSD